MRYMLGYNTIGAQAPGFLAGVHFWGIWGQGHSTESGYNCDPARSRRSYAGSAGGTARSRGHVRNVVSGVARILR
jgi:hypothetical protein